MLVFLGLVNPASGEEPKRLFFSDRSGGIGRVSDPCHLTRQLFYPHQHNDYNMTTAVKETKEHPAQKETLTPTQKKNLEETKRKYRGALEQLSRL